MNDAAVNIYVEVFLWTYVFVSPEYMSHIVTLCLMLEGLDCQTVFQSKYTILLSHQQFQLLHLLTNICYYL